MPIASPLGEVLNLSGPPGAGKTTVARLLADYAEPSVHLNGDQLMMSIRRGFTLPWLSGSGDQNRTVISAVASAATAFARGGYWVIADALIGPWFVDAFRAPLSSSRVTLHYAILRPRLKDSIVRAQARGGDALTAEEPIRQLWQAFQELGPYEGHALDLADLSAAEVTALVWAGVNESRFLLKP